MPESIARGLLIHYVLVLLVPLTVAILPPASGAWWLLKGLGAIIAFGTIGNFLSRSDFHRNIIGAAYRGFLLLVLDLGDRRHRFCVLDDAGGMVEEGSVGNDRVTR